MSCSLTSSSLLLAALDSSASHDLSWKFAAAPMTRTALASCPLLTPPEDRSAKSGLLRRQGKRKGLAFLLPRKGDRSHSMGCRVNAQKKQTKNSVRVLDFSTTRPSLFPWHLNLERLNRRPSSHANQKAEPLHTVWASRHKSRPLLVLSLVVAVSLVGGRLSHSSARSRSESSTLGVCPVTCSCCLA